MSIHSLSLSRARALSHTLSLSLSLSLARARSLSQLHMLVGWWHEVKTIDGESMQRQMYVGTRRNYFYSADGAGREAGHAYVLE